MATKLTDRERIFIDAYLGDARLNATQAAIMAGYSTKSAAAAGSRLKKKRRVAEVIERELSKMRIAGITSRRGRVDALEELYNRKLAIIEARARYWQEKIDQQSESPETYISVHDSIAPGAETGLLVRKPVAIGTGRNAQLAYEWAYDTALDRDLRSNLEHMAKELGEWVTKNEHAGRDGAPIEITTVESARESLLMALIEEHESEQSGEDNQ